GEPRTFSSGRRTSRTARRGSVVSSLSEHELLGGIAQIVGRAHAVAVCASIGNQDDVTLPGWRQQTIMPEDIGTFADGTHDIHELGGRISQAGEIRDLMISTIECRPDQGVHTGRDPDVANVPFA